MSTPRAAGARAGAGPAAAPAELIHAYRDVRATTAALCAPLAVEDTVVQTMPDVSPPKWHLAHTSWFFENFLLAPYAASYQRFHPRYGYLFNSYYERVGRPFPRPQRGLLSRPTLDEVMAYRAHVDAGMTELLSAPPAEAAEEIARRVTLGLNHEQQHQELLYTDIKHILGMNPLRPPYRAERGETAGGPAAPLRWLDYPGGLQTVGATGAGFAFDNEGPAHRVYLAPYRLASRPVTCREYLAFMQDGGYREPAHWLAEGWNAVRSHGWEAPLYWEQRDGAWWHYTLGGMRPVDPEAPVCHVSYFEADAYARWADKRLPAEAEWEVAARAEPPRGNFAASARLHPRAASGQGHQFYGDVWEWTQSAYGAYPGYRPNANALGEYNGKFMCGQFVLRGGSCVTAAGHVRASYRNFFYPGDRWQFSGIRLADDA
ncbi:ergothioneine biosynthesis protein EgtB [Ectothiorhodospiraceae bacterium 2226]|nr:ergothioneine biosynthesis protein EgtB [Ectothiorhodospiraceae bacterium 2226]